MVAISTAPTQADQGSAVLAVTWVFAIITFLFVALRISMSMLRKRGFGVDDTLLAVAVVFGLLSALCTSNAVVNGLGRPIATVHAGQLARYFKLSYSSNLFTIFAMGAAKHSVVALVQRVSTGSLISRRYSLSMHSVIASWMLFSVFGIAFQCSMTAPWIYQPSRCAGSGAIWYPIVATDIATDIGLALGFLAIVTDVQLEPNKKSKFAGLFLARLIVPIVSIAYIATLAPALASEDQTSLMTVPSILSQIAMDISILTAAIPALSRALTSFEFVSPVSVVSEITAMSLEPSHARTTSDENNKLRDWAFAQLRNTPTPNSLKETPRIEIVESPRKPEKAQLALDRTDTAPEIPPRSLRRSASPRLTLGFSSSDNDLRDAWFSTPDSNRSSTMTELTIEGARRVSQRI